MVWLGDQCGAEPVAIGRLRVALRRAPCDVSSEGSELERGSSSVAAHHSQDLWGFDCYAEITKYDTKLINNASL